MSAGKLSERVAFDTPAGTTDEFGGEAIAWTEGDPVAAQWVYGKGDETLQAARDAGRKVYKVKVRSSAATRAVKEGHRMRDLRRGLPSGVTGDTLPGDRWNVIEVDAITDRAWVYIVVEGPQPA